MKRINRINRSGPRNWIVCVVMTGLLFSASASWALVPSQETLDARFAFVSTVQREVSQEGSSGLGVSMYMYMEAVRALVVAAQACRPGGDTEAYYPALKAVADALGEAPGAEAGGGGVSGILTAIQQVLKESVSVPQPPAPAAMGVVGVNNAVGSAAVSAEMSATISETVSE